jgi:hypothetical protein
MASGAAHQSSARADRRVAYSPISSASAGKIGRMYEGSLDLET